MPAAARLVALNHLDASAIVGTGLGGRIMRYDVVNYMESAKGAEKTQQSQSKPASVSAPSKKAAKPIVAPISGGSVNYVDEPVLDENKSKMEMDQLIKKTVPHSYLKNDLILTDTLQLIKTLSATTNTPLTLTDFAVKAIANALVRERSLPSVDVNVCVSVSDSAVKSFTISNVQRMNILDIHSTIEESRTSTTVPLHGIVTVCVLDNVPSAGGILSIPQELGTVTIGRPVKSVSVGEDDKLQCCARSAVDLTFNAAKLDEVEGNAVLSAFKTFMEASSPSPRN